MKNCVLAFVLSILGASSLHSQAVPVGAEFQINTDHGYSMGYPAVAIDGAGRFVVVWGSLVFSGDDVLDFEGRVQAQRFDSGGSPVGSEFRVNSRFIYEAAPNPAIAMDSGGNFVVMWRWQDFVRGQHEILAQRFRTDGMPLGAEFRGNSDSLLPLSSPEAVMDSAGNFVSAWVARQLDDAGGVGVQVKRFADDATPTTSHFFPSSANVSLAIAPSGDFVVVWRTPSTDSADSVHRVRAQRYHADGSLLGSELEINTDAVNLQRSLRVAMEPTGDFIVVWVSGSATSPGPDGSDSSIQGQRVRADGSLLGPELQINASAMGPQRDPDLAIGPGGDFVVVWSSPDQDLITGQLFDADGAWIGSEFQVNSDVGPRQGRPAVASAANGVFVVAWESYDAFDPNGPHIRGQRFAFPCRRAPGTACLLGGRFRVEGTMTSFGSPPAEVATRVMGFPTARAESEQAVFFESFTPGTFELGVKVVDGCGLAEDHPLRAFWLFAGGLTNARTELQIEDTVSGQIYEWSSPADEFPFTLGDTGAFPCVQGTAETPCARDRNTACLIEDRFRVTGSMWGSGPSPREFPVAVMSFPGGRAESAQSVFFESFSPGNFEVGVKMIDACSLPADHPLRAYWVFYGGLTNAETSIRVTQISTGLQDVWSNPPGVLPQSEGRTQAFPCEPM